MKVLYIGNHHDGTGWSTAAIRQTTALQMTPTDLCVRPIKLNQSHCPVSPTFQKLVRSPEEFGRPDVVIQHVLPSMLVKTEALNVAYFAGETSTYPEDWVLRLNWMDQVWVVNRQMKEACRTSGVTVPIYVVPHAFDLNELEGDSSFPVPCPTRQNGHFVFYYIGEAIRRKNLGGLLKAFHTEFAPGEPVELVLKVSVPGLNPEQTLNYVRRMTEETKKSLRLYRSVSDYHEETILCGRLTEQELIGLHRSCDCYITTSFGEAWSWPAFEAMALGRTPIVPASSGFLDWASRDCLKVPTTEEIATGAMDAPDGVHTARTTWWSPDLLATRRVMRLAYERKIAPYSLPEEERRQRGKQRAKRYSYETVGKYMADLLEVASGNKEKVAAVEEQQGRWLRNELAAIAG